MEQIKKSLGPWFQVFLSLYLIAVALVFIFHITVPDLLIGALALVAGILGIITS